MELKCYLLDRMVEAREEEITPASGDTYTAYYCNLCDVAECHEDKERIIKEPAFEMSLLRKHQYDRVKKLKEG